MGELEKVLAKFPSNNESFINPITGEGERILTSKDDYKVLFVIDLDTATPEDFVELSEHVSELRSNHKVIDFDFEIDHYGRKSLTLLQLISPKL